MSDDDTPELAPGFDPEPETPADHPLAPRIGPELEVYRGDGDNRWRWRIVQTGTGAVVAFDDGLGVATKRVAQTAGQDALATRD